MAELIAQGSDPNSKWRRVLPAGKPVVIGRSEGTWLVPWDKKISRHHAEVRLRGERLEVARLRSGRNAIYRDGVEVDEFSLGPGGCFVIGETTFTFLEASAKVAEDPRPPIEQRTYSRMDLEAVRFRHADQKLDVLSRLPGVIAGSTGDGELFVRLTQMLLAGMPRADAAAIVAVEPGQTARGSARLLHWDTRGQHSGDVRPSERLVFEAIRRGEGVSHVWGTGPVEFTQVADVDWAFCVPVGGDPAEGWAIYVAGKASAPALSIPTTDLTDDLKFTELVAAVVGALRQVKRLEHRHATLSQFFSPVVIHTLADSDAEAVLAPRQAEIAVLSCDLRGMAGVDRGADLFSTLERISKALRIMTFHVLDHGGVMGDFRGDSAVGFWGWPLHQGDVARRACLAALGMRTQLLANSHRQGNPLEGFRIGIGVATGPAVVGKIGTADQAKVGVLGPVADLASRLERMADRFPSPVLVDDRTAALARQVAPAEQMRLRRVARVLPEGFDAPLTIHELLPPLAEDPSLADDHIAHYESALEAVQEGRWSQALASLARVPTEDDVREYLTGFIARHNRVPPDGWDGVMPIPDRGDRGNPG